MKMNIKVKKLEMNVKMKIKREMTVVVRKEGNRRSRVEHLNKETKRWNRNNYY